MAEHPEPSARARELVRGGYDLHIHIAPDVMQRRITDLELAQRFRDVGLAGFALKSHYLPTAERAAVVTAAVPGVRVFGALTLNGSVGGMNPIAAELSGRSGAGIVWLPTVDSGNQRRSRAQDPPGAKPPMWGKLQDELREAGISCPPIEVLDGDGKVTEETRQVLRVIAAHDMVLATGHLSRDEIDAAVDAAVDEGVERIMVTHPEFTSQRLSIADQQRLAERGALLERCFTTAYTGKVEWSEMFDAVRATGPEHSVFSSDLGQPFNPPVEDGLALMADFYLEAGFSEDDVRTMAVTNTNRLIGGATR